MYKYICLGGIGNYMYSIKQRARKRIRYKEKKKNNIDKENENNPDCCRVNPIDRRRISKYNLYIMLESLLLKKKRKEK